MGYSNGLLEQNVGKGGRGERGERGLPGIGFNFTDDGNFDIDGKRLTDVGAPSDENDASTKKYTDDNLDLKLDKDLKSDLDLKNNKIINLADPTDDGDAVNFKELKNHTQFSSNHFNLQPSFTFLKNFGDKTLLKIANPPNVSNNHFFSSHKMHNQPYIVEKEGYDSGFGGNAWSSIKMLNFLLDSGSYTALFEIFTIGENGNFRTNDTIIFNVHAGGNYKIITFNSNKIDDEYTKSIIRFTTDGRVGNITFKIIYYGTEYDKDIKFLFYSRVTKGSKSTSFNHQIFNISYVDDKKRSSTLKILI